MTVGDGYRTIGYEVSNGVATITLDRPEHMNAFTVRMCLEMIDAFDRVDDDPGRADGFLGGVRPVPATRGS